MVRPVRAGVPGDALPAGEAFGEVTRQLRLDADHARRRAARLDRDGDAADQPASADRDEHGCRLGQVVDDLQTDGALPGDHVGGRRTVARRPPRYVGPDPVDLGARSAMSTSTTSAPRASVAARLTAGDCVRHHDRRRHAERRERLGRHAWAWLPDECVMTPRARSLVVQGRDRVGGAARLERSAELEALGLERSGTRVVPRTRDSGVRRTTPAIRAAATSTSGRVTRSGSSLTRSTPRPYDRCLRGRSAPRAWLGV